MIKTYKFTEKEDKHFYAGLFNTACNNFSLSIKELAKRIGYKPEIGDNAILDYAFSEERSQHDFDNSFKYLSESLVFLNRIPSFIAKINKNGNNEIIDDKKFVLSTLKSFHSALDSYRNYYTHYDHFEIEVENKYITQFLDYVLFNSTSRIKDDRVKQDAVKKKLLTNYQADFTTIINEKNEWITKKNIELKKDRKKLYKKIQHSPAGNNFALNHIFRDFIDDSSQNPILKKDRVSSNGSRGLQKSGFIQLLALFLTKKEVNLLLDNIVYTYRIDDTKLQKTISRWIYTLESYKSIKHLFKSEYDEHSLLLQMVSELSKCPSQLYNQLSEKHKDEFLEDINVYSKSGSELFNDDDLVSHEVTRKRYEDKFPYFAIRFLDEFAKFPSLKFHVNLGKFNHDTRTKSFKSTSTETTRKILENLTVFENLTIATKKKNEYLEKREEENENNTEIKKDWVEFPRPKYQFYKNNIGIWLDIHGQGEFNEEELKRENEKITKADILDKLGLKENHHKPIAFLSFNELPALLYSLLVERKKGAYIENRIKGKIKKQINFISKIEEEKKYTEEEIKHYPKKIKTILQSDININKKKIVNLLEDEITVNPLEEIRKKYIPRDEKKLSLKEKGEIATWLSKDIKRFVSKKTKEHWKGYQFSEFQALLSMYNKDRLKVENFLIEDLTLNIEDYPFAGFNFNSQTLFDFYTFYINKRKKHLINNRDLKNINTIEEAENVFPFKASYITIKHIKEYKKYKLTEPVMLQRGIFDDKPTYSYKKKANEVAKWFDISMDINKAQDFYLYDKTYEIKTKKARITQSKGIKEQTNGMSYKDKNDIYKNESSLRKTMRNDYYMLQMIRFHFLKTSDADSDSFKNITLNDFFLTKKEKSKYEENRLEFNEKYILNKRIELPLLDGRILDTVALKDSSKYKRLSQDKRVIQLVEYDADKVWNFLELDNELSDYELVRSKRFYKSLHSLEEKILEKAIENNETEELLVFSEITNNKFPNFSKYLNYYFKTNNSASEETKRLLTLIRNKFSHNQLIPKTDYDKLKETYNKKEEERVATFLNRVFVEMVEFI